MCFSTLHKYKRPERSLLGMENTTTRYISIISTLPTYSLLIREYILLLSIDRSQIILDTSINTQTHVKIQPWTSRSRTINITQLICPTFSYCYSIAISENGINCMDYHDNKRNVRGGNISNFNYSNNINPGHLKDFTKRTRTGRTAPKKRTCPGKRGRMVTLCKHKSQKTEIEVIQNKNKCCYFQASTPDHYHLQ